ncbi:MAG: hypothetical protein QNJ97_04710 [Myxococcota bacterium]|nr:hypothetical protein [Myxococcota bacterium]
MLPAYIIDELLKREQTKELLEEVCVELPDIDPLPNPLPPSPEVSDEDIRGIVIVDFTI